MLATIIITIVLYTMMTGLCFIIFDTSFNVPYGDEKLPIGQLLRRWIGLTLFSPVIIALVLAAFFVVLLLVIPILLVLLALCGLIHLFGLDSSYIS